MASNPLPTPDFTGSNPPPNPMASPLPTPFQPLFFHPPHPPLGWKGTLGRRPSPFRRAMKHPPCRAPALAQPSHPSPAGLSGSLDIPTSTPCR